MSETDRISTGQTGDGVPSDGTAETRRDRPGRTAVTAVTVLGFAAVFLTAAFTMSYAALYQAAGWLEVTPVPLNGGDLRFMFPLVIDGLIAFFMGLDLWSEWRGVRHPLYRWTAYGLGGLTLWINLGDTGQGGLLAHAAPPLAVILVSEGLATWTRSVVGLSTGQRVSDRVPLGHWLARPSSAFRIRRLMLGWNVESYPEAVEMDRRRSLSYAMLRQQYGRRWRRNTPVQLRWMLDNGHDLDTAYDLVRVLTSERVAMTADEARTVQDSGQDTDTGQDTLPVRHSVTRRDRVARTRQILSGLADSGRLSTMSAGDLDNLVATDLGVSPKSANRYRKDAAEPTESAV